MKKLAKLFKEKTWFKLVLAAVVIVAVVGLFSLLNGGSKPTADSKYTVLDIGTGDLQQTVSAAGSLSAPDVYTFSSPVALTIDEYFCRAGDSVKAGDPVARIKSNSIDSGISALQAELSALETKIADLYNYHEDNLTLIAPQYSRVKKILAAKGDDARSVMEQYGALMVLSGDGYMRVDAPLSEAYGVGDKLKVLAEGKTYNATVVGIKDGVYSIRFTDNGPPADAQVTVLNAGGEEIGSGAAVINAPISVIASGGTVSRIYVSLNQKVDIDTSLIYLKDIPLSDDYTAAVSDREEMLGNLQTALIIQSTGIVTSPEDGVIASIGGLSGTILTLYQGGATKMDVTVDELDVGSIATGQKALVTLDAVPGLFEGEVTHISAAGANTSGVTTYGVIITLEPDDALMIGMNATATIVIAEKKGVVLVPLSAIQYSRGEQYVWLYQGSLPADGTQEPGVRTPITTGLSNSAFAEVTSGLSAGDQVVVVSAASDNSMLSGGMPVMGMPGGEARQGADRLPDGEQRTMIQVP